MLLPLAVALPGALFPSLTNLWTRLLLVMDDTGYRLSSDCSQTILFTFIFLAWRNEHKDTPCEFQDFSWTPVSSNNYVQVWRKGSMVFRTNERKNEQTNECRKTVCLNPVVSISEYFQHFSSLFIAILNMHWHHRLKQRTQIKAILIKNKYLVYCFISPQVQTQEEEVDSFFEFS